MSNEITQLFKQNQIDSLIDEIASGNSIFYAVASDFTPSNATTPDQPGADYDANFMDPYRNGIFAKQITSTNVKEMVNNYKWISGTIYEEWDHTADLSDKQYFVIVDNTTEFYCFICVDSPGTASVDKPLKTDTSPDDDFYITNDSYHWKYLFTISLSNYNTFSTLSYVPIFADANVTSNAVSGAIDKIKVIDSGANYNTFYANNFTDDGIAVGGNNLVYGIGTNANVADDFYIDSVITLTANTGAGQLRRITDYFTVSNQHRVAIDSPFTTTPDVTTRYEITPGVLVFGTGSGAVARAIPGSANSITSVEVLERGSNYSFATAIVTGNTGGANTLASLQVLLPPIGGHGANPGADLSGLTLGVSFTFANSESNTIPTNGEYGQFAILKNPEYSKVVLTITMSYGQFVPNETVYGVQPIHLGGTVSVNTTSNTVVGTGTEFNRQLKVGDLVYVSNNSSASLKEITVVTNSTSIQVNSDLTFACTTANVYSLKVVASGEAANIQVGNLTVLDSTGQFKTGNNYLIIGAESGSAAVINTLALNGFSKGYGTLDLRWKFNTPTGVSVSFSAGDVIDQGNATITSAVVHSFDSANGVLYVGDMRGTFTPGVNVFSGSNTILLNSITEPDINLYTGDLLYIENVRALERDAAKSELFKLIFQL
jgi:hypothetical protein